VKPARWVDVHLMRRASDLGHAHAGRPYRGAGAGMTLKVMSGRSTWSRASGPRRRAPGSDAKPSVVRLRRSAGKDRRRENGDRETRCTDWRGRSGRRIFRFEISRRTPATRSWSRCSRSTRMRATRGRGGGAALSDHKPAVV